jgi:ArsR family transcriptional regulator
MRNEFVCDCHPVDPALTEKVILAMPEGDTLERLSSFYKVLASSNRCKIVCALLDNELCVCDLANILSMTKSAVSHQLALLRKFGVVKYRQYGLRMYYSLDDHHVEDMFRVSLAHMEHRG